MVYSNEEVRIAPLSARVSSANNDGIRGCKACNFFDLVIYLGTFWDKGKKSTASTNLNL